MFDNFVKNFFFYIIISTNKTNKDSIIIPVGILHKSHTCTFANENRFSIFIFGINIRFNLINFP